MSRVTVHGSHMDRIRHARGLLDEATSLFLERVVWRPGVKPPKPKDYAEIAQLLRDAGSAALKAADAFDHAGVMR